MKTSLLKGGRQAAFFALMVSLATLSAVYAQNCPELLAETRRLERQNPTALWGVERYVQPKSRTLGEYNELTAVSKQSYKSLEAMVSVGGLFIDVGGGSGVAAREMALRKKIRAVVINKQDFQVDSEGPLLGEFIYRVGWAQQALWDYEGQAEVIVDIWGAFSYAPDKAEILNAIYAALRPGGTAFLLYHRSKVRALVDEYRSERDLLHIDEWLAKTYPSLVETFATYDAHTSGQMIVLRKPMDGSGPAQFPLRLQTFDFKVAPSTIFPESILEMIPLQ